MSRKETKEERSEIRAALALSRIRGLGSFVIRKLLKRFGRAEEVFRAGRTELRSVDGIGQFRADSILGFRGWADVDRILDQTDRSGFRLFTFSSPAYPHYLSQVPDPPVVLWARGNLDLLNRPMIAIVGTRRADRYGREQAVRWSKAMADAGLTVVSGLAVGIDALAHRAALKRKGCTMAVLPGGLNRIYPVDNQPLAESIVESDGLLLSERPPFVKADQGAFPRRNRIVSGLTLGVIVIQTRVGGGSMITSRHSLDYSREVFVVPHSLDQPAGYGNLEVIRDGCGKLIARPEDVWVELAPFFEPETDLHGGGESTGVQLSKREQRIARLLFDAPITFDHLVVRSGLESGELHSLLLGMELKGVVRQRPGRTFEWSGGDLEAPDEE